MFSVPRGTRLLSVAARSPASGLAALFRSQEEDARTVSGGPSLKRCRLRGKQVEREATSCCPRPVGPWRNARSARCFCPSRNGAAARAQLTRGETKCLFCSGEQMQKMNEAGRSNGITAALERFCAASPSVYFAALDRVRRFLGQEAAKEYVARGQLCRGKRQAKGGKSKASNRARAYG